MCLSLELEISKSASFTIGGLTLETRTGIFFADGCKKDRRKGKKRERNFMQLPGGLLGSESDSVTVMLQKIQVNPVTNLVTWYT